MDTNSRRGLCIVVISSIFGATASSASAAIYTFNFDTIVSGDTPSGSMIATMTIEDTAADTVLVTLNHNATSAPGQFISDLLFNLNPFITPIQAAQTPINKFDGGLMSGLNAEHDAGLNFDLRQQFQVSGSGGGVNRLKPGESISFTLTGSGLNASDFDSTDVPTGGNRDDIVAMIHLQGIPGGGSVKLGSTETFGSAPEPASMGALSLGVLALLRKLKKKKA